MQGVENLLSIAQWLANDLNNFNLRCSGEAFVLPVSGLYLGLKVLACLDTIYDVVNMGVWPLKQHNNSRPCSPLVSQKLCHQTNSLVASSDVPDIQVFFFCTLTISFLALNAHGGNVWHNGFLLLSTVSHAVLATDAATTRIVLLLLLLLVVVQQLDDYWLWQWLCCWLMVESTLFWLLMWPMFVLLALLLRLFLAYGLTIGTTMMQYNY